MDSALHRTIHQIGWVAWFLFSVAIHFWAILIASRIPESGARVLSTALLPVISWFRLALILPDRCSLMRNAFAASLLAWLGCLILLIADRRFKHALHRSDRLGWPRQPGQSLDSPAVDSKPRLGEASMRALVPRWL
jgi:hypothetical protein